MADPLWETMDYWLTRKQARGRVTAQTAETQRLYLRSFSDWMGPSATVGEVTTRDFEGWLAQLRTKRGAPLMPGSQNTVASPVRAFFRWAVLTGLTSSDPCLDVERAIVPPSVPRSLSKSDIQRLIKACPDLEWRSMIRLTVCLGLRIGDLAQMRVEHWRPDEQVLRVTGKGGSTYELATDGEAGDVLEAWIDHGLDGAAFGPMWPSRNDPDANYSRSWIGANIKRIGRRAGVDLHAHMLRHTTATHLDRAGVPVPVGMRIMRHRSMSSYQKYTVADTDETRPYLLEREPYHDRTTATGPDWRPQPNPEPPKPARIRHPFQR